MMWDYKFYDYETGEQFFVECETLDEAERIAHENFEDPVYDGKYSPEEADILGLDTY